LNLKFRKHDWSDDRTIAAEDLKCELTKIRRFFYSMDDIEDLISKCGRNKNGLISIDEFADLLKYD
jgi:hypothetical protein